LTHSSIADFVRLAQIRSKSLIDGKKVGEGEAKHIRPLRSEIFQSFESQDRQTVGNGEITSSTIARMTQADF
jgi:hypothetical protein